MGRKKEIKIQIPDFANIKMKIKAFIQGKIINPFKAQLENVNAYITDVVHFYMYLYMHRRFGEELLIVTGTSLVDKKNYFTFYFSIPSIFKTDNMKRVFIFTIRKYIMRHSLSDLPLGEFRFLLIKFPFIDKKGVIYVGQTIYVDNVVKAILYKNGIEVDEDKGVIHFKIGGQADWTHSIPIKNIVGYYKQFHETKNDLVYFTFLINGNGELPIKRGIYIGNKTILNTITDYLDKLFTTYYIKLTARLSI